MKPTVDRKAFAHRALLVALLVVLGVVLLTGAALANGGEEGEHGDGDLTATLHEVGVVLAIVAFFGFIAQFILASRLHVLDRLIGLNRLMLIHRAVGGLALLCAAMHPVLIFGFQPQNMSGPLWNYWMFLPGVAALMIALFVVLSTAWSRMLGLRYEVWRRFHWMAYLIPVLILIHASAMEGESVWPMLAVGIVVFGGWFVWLHAIRRGLLRRKAFTVRNATALNHDVTRLEFEAPEGVDYRHAPGQFHFLTLLRDDAPKEEHPFTISSAPSGEPPLTNTIKASGDYTKTMPDVKPGTRALLDGPYGRFSHTKVKAADGLLLIAGGVGITPLMSMLREIVDTDDPRAVTLVWGNKTPDDIFLREELEAMESQRENLRVVHVLDDPPDDWQGEVGLVTRELLGRALGEEELQRHIFLCGPPPMMKMVKGALGELGVSRRRIHTEAFAL